MDGRRRRHDGDGHCGCAEPDRHHGGAYFANKKSAALIAYRLEQLEQKVAKQNGLVERTYHLEEEAAVFEEKLKVANHRIDDLEHGT